MKAQYALEESEYRAELDTFWNLLEKSGDILEGARSVASTAESVEIESKHFVPCSPVADVQSAAYSQDEGYGSSSAQSVAQGVADPLFCGLPEAAQPMKHRQSVDISVPTEPEPTVFVAAATEPEPEVKAEPVGQ